MYGRWKLLDIAPVRLDKEKTTRNTVRSLNNGTLLVIKTPDSMTRVEVV
jgi:hypothetical protein